MDFNEIAANAGPPVIFMLAVWFMTLTVRRIVEHLAPAVTRKGTWWTDVVLPTLPFALGAGFGIVMHKFPGLDKFPTWGTRALYGLVGGAMSGLLYRVVKALAKKKYGVELSMPPGAVSGATVTVTVPPSELPKIDVHYPPAPDSQVHEVHPPPPAALPKPVEEPDSQKPTDPGAA